LMTRMGLRLFSCLSVLSFFLPVDNFSEKFLKKKKKLKNCKSERTVKETRAVTVLEQEGFGSSG
jgi:hypothetical protein